MNRKADEQLILKKWLYLNVYQCFFTLKGKVKVFENNLEFKHLS